MTRRTFLTTAVRAATLALLLPFLPPVVKRTQAERQPGGSMLFDGVNYEYLKPSTFSLKEPITVYMLIKDNRVLRYDQYRNGELIMSLRQDDIAKAPTFTHDGWIRFD